MSSLAFSDSFEYLCYGSMVIMNIFTLTVPGSTSDVTRQLESDVYRRQILTTKVGPGTVRVKTQKSDKIQDGRHLYKMKQ